MQKLETISDDCFYEFWTSKIRDNNADVCGLYLVGMSKPKEETMPPEELYVEVWRMEDEYAPRGRKTAKKIKKLRYVLST